MPDNEQNLGFRPVFTKRAEKKLTPRIDALKEKGTPEKPLNKKDSAELTKLVNERTKINRRRLLTWGVGAGATLVLGGAGVKEATSSHKETEVTNQHMSEVIHGLPDSHIKSLLVDLVLPRFEGQTDQLVEDEGFSYTVSPAKVYETTTHHTTVNLMHGDVNFNISTNPNDEVTPLTPPIIKLAFPESFFADYELPDLDADVINKNGVPIFEYDPTEGDTYFDKLTSDINIRRVIFEGNPDAQDASDQIADFTYVKEACSALAEMLVAENIAKRTRHEGLPITMKAKDHNGQIKDVDFVHTGLLAIASSGGRTKQIMDGGGFMLALEAMRGSDFIANMGDNFQDFKALADVVMADPIEGDNDAIVNKMIRLSVDNSETLKTSAGIRGDAYLYP